jgi:hypothetical protein
MGSVAPTMCFSQPPSGQLPPARAKKPPSPPNSELPLSSAFAVFCHGPAHALPCGVLPVWTENGTIIRPGTFTRGPGDPTLVDLDEPTMQREPSPLRLMTPRTPMDPLDHAKVRDFVARSRAVRMPGSARGRWVTLVAAVIGAVVGACVVLLVQYNVPDNGGVRDGSACGSDLSHRAPGPKRLVFSPKLLAVQDPPPKPARVAHEKPPPPRFHRSLPSRAARGVYAPTTI